MISWRGLNANLKSVGTASRHHQFKGEEGVRTGSVAASLRRCCRFSPVIRRWGLSTSQFSLSSAILSFRNYMLLLFRHRRYSNVAWVSYSNVSHIPLHRISLMRMKNLSPDHNERDSKSRKRKWQASDRSRNGARTEYCIYRLWATGLTSSGYFPSSVKLESVSSETLEREKQEKQWVLVCHSPLRDDRETSVNPTRFLWLPVAEKIQQDLHTGLQNWMNNMKSQKAGVGKPSFVARIGKVYFHGTAMNLNTIQASLDAETSSRKKVKKTFYTNVSDAYMEAAERLAVPETGFESESRKEYYHIKVLDKLGSTISCKCFPTKGGKLQLNKVESSTVRHLIADILCLGKDFDLRLMLATRETFGKLPDDADQAIRELIKSAIVDPTALGGLRWPTGMESFGGFSVSAVWHTKFAVFKSPTMTMKLRDADRFDFASSTVEVSKEVLVK